jgi:hypothetical protein
MWINSQGQIYAGDCIPGDKAATAAQVAAWQTPITLSQYESAVQNNLDAYAETWGYNNLLSAASYANSTVAQYKADATALIAWRDATWQMVESLQAQLADGTVQLPATSAAFLAMLPAAPARPVTVTVT